MKSRLLKKRTVEKTTGCWLWTGSKTSNGYGQINLKGRNVVVHRVAFEEWVGEIGSETVHHKCATRLCFNPDHLQRVTQRENTAEMFARTSLERRIVELEDSAAAQAQTIEELRAQLALMEVATWR